jgi:hypothetical protein
MRERGFTSTGTGWVMQLLTTLVMIRGFCLRLSVPSLPPSLHPTLSCPKSLKTIIIVIIIMIIVIIIMIMIISIIIIIIIIINIITISIIVQVSAVLHSSYNCPFLFFFHVNPLHLTLLDLHASSPPLHDDISAAVCPPNSSQYPYDPLLPHPTPPSEQC